MRNESNLPASRFENDRIDRSDRSAMRGWTKLLGVSESEILIAVAVAGPFAEDVRAYLRSCGDDPFGPGREGHHELPKFGLTWINSRNDL